MCTTTTTEKENNSSHPPLLSSTETVPPNSEVPAPLLLQDESKLAKLYTKLYPRVENHLIFCGATPFIQSNIRNNMFQVVSKVQVMDWLRMLLPIQDRLSFRTSDFNEIFNVFRAEFQSGPIEDTFNCHPNFVNLRNGMAEITPSGPRLVDDDPRIRFTYYIDATFDRTLLPSFTNSVFEGFWQTSLDGDPKKLQLLLEFLGYSISDATAAKAIMFWAGVSNSGKSVLCCLLDRLIVGNCVTHFPLHEISNPYNGQQLCEGKLNISAELDARPLTVDATLKSISSSEDRITVSRKYRDARSMLPRTKLLCAVNTMPTLQTGDLSDAIFNRLEVLLFNTTIPKANQDLHLFDKLWNERSMIVTHALIALADLAQRNFCFTHPADTDTFLADYRHNANSFLAFETACLDYGSTSDYFIGCKASFEIYKQYCKDTNLTPIKKGLFRQYLLSRSGVNEATLRSDPHDKSHQIRCYTGVKIV